MKAVVLAFLLIESVFATFTFTGKINYKNGTSTLPLKSYTLYYQRYIKASQSWEIGYQSLEINSADGGFSLSIDHTLYSGIGFKVALESYQRLTSIRANQSTGQAINLLATAQYQTLFAGKAWSSIAGGTVITMNSIFPTATITNNTLVFGNNQAYESSLFSALPTMGVSSFIDAAYIYSQCVDGYDLVKTVTTTNPKVLAVLYDPTSLMGGQTWPNVAKFVQEYDGRDWIYIGQNFAKNAYAINHEFGHHIQNSYARPIADAGGDHYVGVSYSPGLAYSEGWAHFFSFVRNNNPTFQIGSETYNAETFFTHPAFVSPNQYKCQGYENEFAVAGYLWDLYDNNNDNNGISGGLVENNSTTFANLFNAMKNQIGAGSYPTIEPRNFIEYLYNLKALGYSASLTALNSAFKIPDFITCTQVDNLSTKITAMAENTMAYLFPGNYLWASISPIDLKNGQYIMGQSAGIVKVFGNMGYAGAMFSCISKSNVKIENIRTLNRISIVSSTNIQVENCIIECPLEPAPSISCFNSDKVMVNNNLFSGTSRVWKPLQVVRSSGTSILRSASFINNTCANIIDGVEFLSYLNPGTNKNDYNIYNNIIYKVGIVDDPGYQYYGIINRNEYPGSNDYVIANNTINQAVTAPYLNPSLGVVNGSTANPLFVTGIEGYLLSANSPCKNSGSSNAGSEFFPPIAPDKYLDRAQGDGPVDRGVYGGPKAPMGGNLSITSEGYSAFVSENEVSEFNGKYSIKSNARSRCYVAIAEESGTVKTPTAISALDKFWTVFTLVPKKELSSFDLELTLSKQDMKALSSGTSIREGTRLVAIQDSSVYELPYDIDKNRMVVTIKDYQIRDNAALFFTNRQLYKKIDETLTAFDNDDDVQLENQPNPFNPSTLIRFSLNGITKEKERVRLCVYDIKGHLVSVLADETLGNGSYAKSWNARDFGMKRVGAGLYTYVLTVGGRKFSRKMLLVQ
jgi:hypothetical protein